MGLENVALPTTFRLLAASLSPPTFCPALVVMLEMCLVQVSLLTTGTAKMSCSSFSGSLMSPKIRLTLLDSSYLRLSGICTWLTWTNPLPYAHIHLIQRSSSGVTQLSMEHYSIQRLNGRTSILYKCCVQRKKRCVWEWFRDTKLFMYTCTAKHRLEVQVEKDSHMISITIPILIPAVLHSKSISSFKPPHQLLLFGVELCQRLFLNLIINHLPTLWHLPKNITYL